MTSMNGRPPDSSGLRIPGEHTIVPYRNGGHSSNDVETDSITQGTRSTHSGQSTRARDTSKRTRKPKYPQYAVLSDRMVTYKEWPEELTQRPEQMARAGFYYSGVADSVRCHFCAVGLRNWDPEDDPWVEHARWSPRCAYIIEQKGQDFIELVQNAAREQQIEESLAGGASSQVPSKDIATDCPIPPKPDVREMEGYQPTAAERKNPMLCDAAQSVLSLGYLPKVVKMAVDQVLATEGWKGMKGDRVAEILFEMEDRKEINLENCKVPKTELDNSRPKLLETVSQDKQVLQQQNSELKERMLCKICCENKVAIVFLPCGHLTSCAQCSPALKTCPVCRVGVRGTVRVCFS